MFKKPIPDTNMLVEVRGDGFLVEVDMKGTWVAVEDVERVAVVTTSQGPFLPDAFFVLDLVDGRRLVVDQEDPASQSLLVLMQDALPGFDNGAFIAAMSFVEDAVFVVWEKTAFRTGGGRAA
ncbi:MAG: hypothetical protein Kow0069_35470 [Promethearchaeota archaeon]